MLACLGLSSQAESVYRIMLRRPSWTLDKLAAEAGIEAGHAEALYRELEALQLTRPSWDEPGKNVAVRPHLGLEKLISVRQSALAEQQRELETARAAALELMEEHSSHRDRLGGEHIEYLEGLDSTRMRIAELSRQVQDEVLAFIPRAALTPESIEASRELDGEILGRGVSMRTLYLDTVRNHTPTRQYASWLSSLGGEVRTTPVLPMRLIVIDRRLVVLPIDPSASRNGAVLIREPSVVSALLALFENTWESARALGAAHPKDEHGLTAQERHLLKMLASGMTDEAAGKRLGLSMRSIRRVMADLMQRLEAGSRFEAGVRAVERGWL